MSMLAAATARRGWGDPASLCEAVSWDRLLIATAENLKPYLHWVSEQMPFASEVPPEVQAELAAARASTRIKNLRWAAELRQIADAFRKSRVPLMMIKGSALQRTIYPDPSTRPMNDADLVVRRSDMPQVDGIMAGLSFLRRTAIERQTPAPGRDPDEEGYFFKTVGSSTLLVEMHTRLEMQASVPRGSMDSLWDRLIEVRSTDGILLPTLEPHGALCQLCLHLAKHGFDSGLLWLLDIRLFLEHHGRSIDWNALRHHCSENEMRKVAFALTLAAEWLGADVPPSGRTALPPEKWRLAAALAWDQMHDQARAPKPPNAVILLLSGNPRRLWRYLRDHFRRWTTPIPGTVANPLLLMGQRVWSDLRIFRSAFLRGGFKLASMNSARRSDRRSEQLHAILALPQDK